MENGQKSEKKSRLCQVDLLLGVHQSRGSVVVVVEVEVGVTHRHGLCTMCDHARGGEAVRQHEESSDGSHSHLYVGDVAHGGHCATAQHAGTPWHWAGCRASSQRQDRNADSQRCSGTPKTDRHRLQHMLDRNRKRQKGMEHVAVLEQRYACGNGGGSRSKDMAGRRCVDRSLVTSVQQRCCAPGGVSGHHPRHPLT